MDIKVVLNTSQFCHARKAGEIRITSPIKKAIAVVQSSYSLTECTWVWRNYKHFQGSKSSPPPCTDQVGQCRYEPGQRALHATSSAQ